MKIAEQLYELPCKKNKKIEALQKAKSAIQYKYLFCELFLSI